MMDPIAHLSQYWEDSSHPKAGPVVCGNAFGQRMTHKRFSEDLQQVWFQARETVTNRPTVTKNFF